MWEVSQVATPCAVWGLSWGHWRRSLLLLTTVLGGVRRFLLFLSGRISVGQLRTSDLMPLAKVATPLEVIFETESKGPIKHAGHCQIINCYLGGE